MKLLINTASADRGGSVQVALSFLAECKETVGHEYHVFLSPNVGKSVEQSSFPSNFNFHQMAQRPSSRVFSLNPMSRAFSKLESSIQPDCVFTTSGPSYWRPRAPHLIGYNLPHYIYRDSPFWKRVGFRERLQFNLKGILIQWFFRRDADAYVVQTDNVNQRLQAFIAKTDVHTVSNTCSAAYYSFDRCEAKLPLRSEGEFRALTLSALYTHKNLEIIRAVVDEFRRRGRSAPLFVLTIEQADYDSVFGKSYRKEVLTVGPVPPSECPSLYEECDAMFLPTLLECFSASYPEAMIMKKPILTSELGFAQTVCKDAALYFDPLNASEITDQFERLMDSEELREGLVERGSQRVKTFNNAHERAKAFLSICEGLCSKRSE
ncbi:MAG: glycosyltransferase involved in cell wall biosynthesis [Lentimonas sp.]|jgi:glycosyltransferase involved in cell wall biosynthesis